MRTTSSWLIGTGNPSSSPLATSWPPAPSMPLIQTPSSTTSAPIVWRPACTRARPSTSACLRWALARPPGSSGWDLPTTTSSPTTSRSRAPGVAGGGNLGACLMARRPSTGKSCGLALRASSLDFSTWATPRLLGNCSPPRQRMRWPRTVGVHGPGASPGGPCLLRPMRPSHLRCRP